MVTNIRDQSVEIEVLKWLEEGLQLSEKLSEGSWRDVLLRHKELDWRGDCSRHGPWSEERTG